MLRHVWARCCAERAHIRDCHTSACLTPREACQFIALAGSSWEWHWMRGCPVHVWRLGHLSWPAAEHLPVAPAANSLTLGLHGSFSGAGTTEQSKQSMSASKQSSMVACPPSLERQSSPALLGGSPLTQRVLRRWRAGSIGCVGGAGRRGCSSDARRTWGIWLRLELPAMIPGS